MNQTSRVGATIERLSTVAVRSGPRAAREKLRLLDRLAACPIRQPRRLLQLHESLCFLQAYPDDARILAATSRALDEFPTRVSLLGPPAVRRLHDSGIAGTALEYSFGFPMARWLTHRFPRDVDVAWERFRDDDRIREVLALLVHPLEEEAFGEFGLDWRHWLRVAKGGRRLTDLQLFVELFQGAKISADTRDALFEHLALPIRWTHRGPGASRTLARLPWPRPFFRRRRSAAAGSTPNRLDVLRKVARPLSSFRRAPRALGQAIVEAARAALALRHRELYGVAYANPDEVLVADPGGGLRIALIGVLPKHRLPLESFFGYLILQNGVPIGYGGAWHLFGTLEFGVNIFDTFRGGESVHITTQVLRVFRQALGVRAVVLQPFQVGKDNPEALASGAFYFYYRLGFRPQDPEVSHIAEREQEKIARSSSYRSPLAVLKELARAEMYLPLSRGAPASERRIRTKDLAALTADYIVRHFAGDRALAARLSSARVVRVLGLNGYDGWSQDERRSFEQLSLLAALIPDLAQWPTADRRRLARAFRAKGGRSEAVFVRLLDRHRRFRESLGRLLAAARGRLGPGRVLV